MEWQVAVCWLLLILTRKTPDSALYYVGPLKYLEVHYTNTCDLHLHPKHSVLITSLGSDGQVVIFQNIFSVFCDYLLQRLVF